MHDMKDSGVEWIGEIPAHWSPIRFRFIAKITTGNQDTQNADPDGEYPFYVRSPIVERCNNYTFDGKGILMAGDGAGAGRVFHLVDGKYAVHQRVYRFYDFKYMDPVLLKYYLENLFATVMDYGSAKTTVPSVRLPMIQDFVVCVPPKKEQANIVAVLNEKCAQVGSLISNVQAQLEKLKAYKQSLITEVVTKGLDPTVPMKDSGVEWIGEIPKHWSVIPSKFLFANCDERRREGDVQLTASQKYGMISQEEYMRRENARIVLADKGLENWKHVEPFDFVISLRSFQGGLEMSEVTGCATWHYIILRARQRIHPYYYKWLFKSSMYITTLQRTCNYIRDGQDLRYSNFVKVPLCIPTLYEQQKIADFLDRKCAKIDHLITLKQSKIEKLEQYKRSLIYEYVTGKREIL